MASKSVGMFQRPVEYKLNCLEMVYEFSGLNFSLFSNFLKGSLNSGDPYRINKNTNLNYFGKAFLSVCVKDINSIKTVLVKPVFEADVISVTTIFYDDANESGSSLISRMRTSKLAVHQIKLDFYENLKQWVLSNLLEAGFEFVNNYRFIFDLKKLGNNKFFLYQGSDYIEYGNSAFYLEPVAFDDDGHSLWCIVNEPCSGSKIEPSYVISGGSYSFYEKLVINDPDLTINFSGLESYDYFSDSIDGINAYFDSLDSTFI